MTIIFALLAAGIVWAATRNIRAEARIPVRIKDDHPRRRQN